VPNLTLIDVCDPVLAAVNANNIFIGEEICGVFTKGSEGELAQRRSRKAEKDFRGSGRRCQIGLTCFHVQLMS
jgi:hypothetical protein